jgi:peptidoglycan/LPS O-acetylase OafA/YrhL
MCGAPVQYNDIQVIPIGTTRIAEPVAEVHHYHHHTQQQTAPILIEKTGKKWKKLQIWAVMFMGMGVFSCMAAVQDHSPGAPVFTSIFWLIGIALYIYSRVGGWWHHG